MSNFNKTIKKRKHKEVSVLNNFFLFLTNLFSKIGSINKLLSPFYSFIIITYVYLYGIRSVLDYYIENVEDQVLIDNMPSFLKTILLPRIWISVFNPERCYINYLLVLFFVIMKDIFKFSTFLKYNILLVFTSDILVNLAIAYWEVIEFLDSGSFDDELPENYSERFVSGLTFSWSIFYIYSYIKAIRGYYVTIPGFEWLTDSLAYWLEISTPTLRKKFDDYNKI